MSERITIIGLIVAGYGAVLATINSVIQMIAHRRDQVDVVLKVRTNMRADLPRYSGMTLTLITATNRGKRPVTIEGFSSRLLDSRDQYLLVDIRPPIPCELSESQSVTAFVDEAGGDRSYIEQYFVWDSVGRYFGVNMVPWYRRITSRLRRRFAPVERVKKRN